MHAVPLDGHQSRTCVGRRDLDGDLVPRRIFVTVELEIEFGVAFEIAGNVGRPGHGKLDPVEPQAVGIDDVECETPGAVRRQLHLGTARRQFERLPLEFGLLDHGLVRESAVRLLDECRHVAPFHEDRLKTLPCHRFEVAVDGKDTHGSVALEGDEVQLTVRPVPDKHIRRGQEGSSQRLDAASATRLESLHLQEKPVDAVVVLRDIEGQHPDPVLAGGRLNKVERHGLRRRVGVSVGIREHEPGVFREVRGNRRQLETARHAPTLCRGSEQVLQRYPCRVATRLQPGASRHFPRCRGVPGSTGDLFDDRRTDSQAIRLVFLDAERRAAQSEVPAIVVHEVGTRPVAAGRRLGAGLEVPGEEPVVGQYGPGGERVVATRVGDPQLDRRARYGAEVALPHDAEQAHRFARPVQPAIGVDRRLEAFGIVLRRILATDVESRPAQPAIAALVRHERDVGLVPNHEHARFPIPFEVVRRCKPRMTVGVRGGRKDRQSVLAEEFHLGTLDGLAGGYRMHEHVLALVGIGLDQETKIRDQCHTPIETADHPFRLRVPTLNLDEEQAARIDERVEIQGRVDLLPGVTRVQLDNPGGQLGEVVRIEAVPEPGIPDVTARLTRQVVERSRQELLDVHLDGGDAAPGEGEQAVARQGQQGAVLRNGGFLRVVRRPHHFVVRRCQHEVAGGGQPGCDAQVDEAVRRRIEPDALQHRRVPLGGIHRQRQRLGSRQHLRRCLGGGTPEVVSIGGIADAVVSRQQPGLDSFTELLGVDLIGERHRHRLHGISLGIVDDRRADAVDAEVALAVGHSHLREQRFLEHPVAVRGLEVPGHGDGREVLPLGNGDDVRVHVRGPVVGTVFHPVSKFARLGVRCPRCFAERQAKALFEIVARDRVRETETGRHPTFGHVLRMLVEGRFKHPRDERGRLELDGRDG